MFLVYLQRDLLIFRRGGGDLFLLLGFFLLGVSLFAIVLGGDFALLGRVFSAVVWVLLLLSVILVQERVFVLDYRSGFLDDVIIRGLLVDYLFSKLASFYLVFCLPLLFVLPLVFVMFGIGFGLFWGYLVYVGLGLGILGVLVIFGSALVLGLRFGYLLLPILVFPLGLPVLLFGFVGFDGLLVGSFDFGVLFFLVGYFMLNFVLGFWLMYVRLRKA